MQPKDGANGIKLPGRLSLNLSFSLLPFPKFSPANPGCPCSPSQPCVYPALLRSLETRKRRLCRATQTDISSPQI